MGCLLSPPPSQQPLQPKTPTGTLSNLGFRKEVPHPPPLSRASPPPRPQSSQPRSLAHSGSSVSMWLASLSEQMRKMKLEQAPRPGPQSDLRGKMRALRLSFRKSPLRKTLEWEEGSTQQKNTPRRRPRTGDENPRWTSCLILAGLPAPSQAHWLPLTSCWKPFLRCLTVATRSRLTSCRALGNKSLFQSPDFFICYVSSFLPYPLRVSKV